MFLLALFDPATLLLPHLTPSVTQVWVPTEFNRDTFMSSGVYSDKLRVVPQGIEENKTNYHQ